MPALDLVVWFGSEEFATSCMSRLATCEGGGAAGNRAEVLAIDATMEGWEAPAVWDTESGFSSREFDRSLATAGLRGYYHHDAPSWQFFDPAAAAGIHTLSSPAGVPPWEQGSPLRLFLHWAYARAGRRLTHAATLGLEGKGALVVGPSGSGKSGTTLSGLLNGLESAGDDYVMVEQNESVTAHAIFRIFKQDEAGLRRVGLRSADMGAGALNWHGKYEFDAHRLAPRAFVSRLEMRAIILPEIARSRRTRFSRVPPHEAALALAPSAVFQLPGDADEGFRFFAAVARRLPAYRARLSEDPSEIADAIGSLLQETTPNAC